MDYRDLLKRYIAWVRDNQGVDCITQGGFIGIRTNVFDDEEWHELHELAEEAAKALEQG